MNVKNEIENNDLIDKNQISFCISLISQLIEEIELEFNSNSNQINKNKKILFPIFSLLKLQMKLFHDLYFIQNYQLYNIDQFKQVRNIFDKGKENIKKYINEVLLYSKQNFENKNLKNNNMYNVIYSNNSTTNTLIENKNINNKKKNYNTKTFNKNINNYLVKNEERKITNEIAMTTIPKSIDITNNNSNSIPSLHIFKQNKFKKNINNIKKITVKHISI